MTNSDIQEKAVEAMIATNAAIQKLRFYPASSASTRNSIDEAYQAILNIFEQENLLVVTISERGFLICEQLLSEKEQNKLQVKAFLELLVSFGIYQITFEKGLNQEEFTTFLEILGKGSEHVEKQGGLQQVAAIHEVSHIFLNQNRQVPADKENKGGGFARETFVLLVSTLDHILEGKNKENVSQILADSILNKDDDDVYMVLTQKIESEFGQSLFDNIISKMDHEKFHRLLSEIRRMHNDAISGTMKSSEIEPVKYAYQTMMNSDKGAQFRKKDEDEKASLKSQLNSILKGDKEVFKNGQIMKALPKAVEQFFSRGKEKTAEAIIEKLGDALLSEPPDIRSGIAEVLSEIVEKLFSEDRLDTMCKLSHKSAEWIKLEISMPPAGERICIHLQNLTQTLIRNNRFADCNHILETFNLIYCGKIKKEDEKFETLAGNVLKSLSEGGILDPILKEFRTNEDNKRAQAVERLVKLGAASVEQLLNILRESEDKSERSRILKVVSDIMEPAVPALTEQIRQNEPWYYIRNLILLFGRVGDETHLQIIRPFLEHEDLRVRRETLNSVFKIGGKNSEEILLSALPVADDRLKIRIVSMLGAMKCHDAVSHLLKLLESMPRIATELREEMAEKICTALGNIGSHEAILALSDIFEEKKKSLLDKKTYNEKLKAAAANALAMKSDKK